MCMTVLSFCFLPPRILSSDFYPCHVSYFSFLIVCSFFHFCAWKFYYFSFFLLQLIHLFPCMPCRFFFKLFVPFISFLCMVFLLFLSLPPIKVSSDFHACKICYFSFLIAGSLYFISVHDSSLTILSSS